MSRDTKLSIIMGIIIFSFVFGLAIYLAYGLRAIAKGHSISHYDIDEIVNEKKEENIVVLDENKEILLTDSKKREINAEERYKYYQELANKNKE